MSQEVSPFDDALIAPLLKRGALIGNTPKGALVGWGDFEPFSEAPDGRIAFFAPDFFFEEERPWFVPSKIALVKRDLLSEGLEQVLEYSQTLEALSWEEPDQHAFRRRFLQIQREIKSGRWQKAVPVAFEISKRPLSAAHIAQMLRGALMTPSTLVPYGIWDESRGVVGASPELLCRISADGSIETTALAGTRPLSVPPEELRRDPKERHEHELVVDFLKERLGTLGEVWVGDTEVLELPHLRHLATSLRAKPKNRVSVAEVAKLLHPTPALGVSPRHLGWEWLRDMDREAPRGRFGAPFGVQFEDGSALCCVGIRNVEWSAQGAQIGAGCGVVAESQLEREWGELALKRDSVHRLLGV